MLKYIASLIRDNRLSPYAVSVLLKGSGYDHILCEKSIYNYIRSGLIPGVSMKQMAYIKNKKKETVKRLPRLKDAPSIEDRPKDILSRTNFGHWEMDTVYSGKGSSLTTLLVLTERMTLYELIYKMPDRTSSSVVKCLDKIERKFGRKNFKQLFKTITVDNGVEFLDYPGVTKRNRTELYYCHPYCSGERGSNENQNKLIRRWIPKGDDIGLYSDQDISFIQEWINTLPRKHFNGACAGDLYNLHMNIT